jgi:hypothetical protein
MNCEGVSNRYVLVGDTHTLDRVRYLGERGLLRHLMLHGDEGSFIYPWLSYPMKG